MGGHGAPGLDGAPQRHVWSSDQHHSSVISSSSDQAQGHGPRTWPQAPGCHPRGQRPGQLAPNGSPPHPPGEAGHQGQPGGQAGLGAHGALHPLDLPQGPSGSQAHPGDPQTLPAMGTGCSRGWPSLREPRNASLPRWPGGKGGGRPGSRALTLSPHLRGRWVPGPSLEQGRRPGLPLSNRLHTARRVNPEQLRVQGAWLALRGGRLLRPHTAVRGGTQACPDDSGSRRAARRPGAWRPWPRGSRPSLDPGPPGCLPPTSPAPA